MNILYVSERDGRGSGYTTLTDGILGELERRGHNVTMLAFDYRGEEHPFRSAVVPTDNRMLVKQVQAAKLSLGLDAILICFDLSAVEAFGWMTRLDIATLAIFPVESDPVIHPSPWTLAIDGLDAALVESRFGTKLLEDVGLRVTYFPVGVDLDHWRQPSPTERQAARDQWNVDDRFVVLTVCDNHERKNLPAMLAAFALATGRKLEWPPESGKQRKVRHPIDNGYFIINTKRRPSRIGYDVGQLAERFGVQEDTLILQHEQKGGMSAEDLRSLYWAADAFLLLSKAEGLGLPVLEAMACGVPVVGTDCGGIGESLADGRGFAISAEYTYCDPFGNQWRRCADVEKAAEALVKIARNDAGYRAQKAQEYVIGFTWERAGAVLDETLKAAVERRRV